MPGSRPVAHQLTKTSTQGLVINEKKTKYMEVTRIAVNGDHLQCGIHIFEQVKQLSYLGTQINQLNSANCEIQARIISVNRCYYACRALMRSRALKIEAQN